MSIDFIEDVKRSIESSIPTSAGIVGKVTKIIYDDSASISDLVKVIEHDPPLTAKILKVANSAYYGSSTTITSLSRAVVVLGFNTIKEIIVSVSVLHYFFDNEGSSVVDLPGLWLHSEGTARASQIISQLTIKERPEVAYTIGLLHDIGKIVLALIFPVQYAKVVELAAENRCRIILAERRILNTDHTMIGEVLCDLWGLPEEISSAISLHHDPGSMTEMGNKMPHIINLADYMCRKIQIGNPCDSLVPDPSPAALAILGLSQEKVKSNLDIIEQKLGAYKKEIQDFFTEID
ncbi:HDOD domain-containing protein [bacterium]|nr:HDOD domain-containing protein [bacterium]